MEKYKLKKDTFFYKAGTVCKLTEKGNMVLDDNQGTCILHKYQFDSHPDLLDEWFEKIEEKKYDGRVPKKKDMFWFIMADGVIAAGTWDGVDYDRDRFEAGSAFWTREEAEKELKRRKAYVILKEDTKGFVPEWAKSDQRKYVVLYNYYDNMLDIDIVWCYKTNEWGLYFATEEDARASIKNHKQEWLDYLNIEGSENG
jgi:hypothetical protein